MTTTGGAMTAPSIDAATIVTTIDIATTGGTAHAATTDTATTTTMIGGATTVAANGVMTAETGFEAMPSSTDRSIVQKTTV